MISAIFRLSIVTVVAYIVTSIWEISSAPWYIICYAYRQAHRLNAILIKELQKSQYESKCLLLSVTSFIPVLSQVCVFLIVICTLFLNCFVFIFVVTCITEGCV